MGFGGTWYVLNASGNPVTTHASSWVPQNYFRLGGCCIFGFPGFLALLLAELVYGTPVQAG